MNDEQGNDDVWATDDDRTAERDESTGSPRVPDTDQSTDTDRTTEGDQSTDSDRTTDSSTSTDTDQSTDSDRTTDSQTATNDDAHLYRVLATPEAGRLRLLDRKSFEAIVTATSGHDAAVEDLRPGYLIDADLDWSSAEPTVESLSVERPTLYAFADGIDPVFEAAQDAWADARLSGDAMNSQVTRNTDNEVNGVLYVFAEDERGTFEAFREGARPLEPLVDRVNESEEPAPREVFVLRPADGQFVVVTIALQKGGQFADTLRETYDRPRPPESKA